MLGCGRTIPTARLDPRPISGETARADASSRQAGEAVSLATVYNTLRAFCGAGLMQEVTVDGSRSYFDTNIHEHPHFYWEDDGHLTDAPADQMVISRLPEAPRDDEEFDRYTAAPAELDARPPDAYDAADDSSDDSYAAA